MAGVRAAARVHMAYNFENALVMKGQCTLKDVDSAASSVRIGNRVVDRLALSTKRDSGFGIYDSIGIWDLGFGIGFEGGPANPESRIPIFYVVAAVGTPRIARFTRLRISGTL